MPAFPPILGEQPTLLLLGSMPGIKSLQQAQYYAHPRNAFWPIMEALFAVDSQSSYECRKQQLIARGVCVWDVLQDCERPGSLDQDIVLSSERANDFTRFFAAYPTINTVGFNGQAARKIFTRHCKALYDSLEHVQWIDLPSTSPAHAAMTLAQKIDVWSQQLRRPN